MTRKECLEQAMGCVLRDRNSTYGKPEDCFDMIAGLWTAYLGEWITALDVSMMMALLKVARVKANPQHGDSFIDIAGYAACGAELAPVVKKKPGDEVGDPEFKPGDKVQVQRTCHREWENAVYVMSHPSGFGHIVRHPDDGRIAIDVERIRPAPKAEGCEEPEFKYGDSLLVTMPEGEDVHCVYIGESTHPGCCRVRYESGDFNGETDDTVPIDQIRREPAPKAEGCEELVQRIKNNTQCIYGKKGE